MAIIRPEKQAIVVELKQKFSAAKGAVLTDYKGLTVAQDTKLRRKMRDAGVEYRVIKNTMARLAADELGITGMSAILEGTTAVALSYTDPVAPAKVISEFVKEVKTYKVKGGILDGKFIDIDGVKTLANLPSRDVLLAMVCGTLQAPIAGFVRALQGNISNLVYALNAVREQKEN
ncbi:MAG: 50S ribosomal protein L10 [Bacillota bacterium]